MWFPKAFHNRWKELRAEAMTVEERLTELKQAEKKKEDELPREGTYHRRL